MHILIRPETSADHESIRHVNRLAFGQDGEAQLVDALRERGGPVPHGAANHPLSVEIAMRTIISRIVLMTQIFPFTAAVLSYKMLEWPKLLFLPRLRPFRRPPSTKRNVRRDRRGRCCAERKSMRRRPSLGVAADLML